MKKYISEVLKSYEFEICKTENYISDILKAYEFQSQKIKKISSNSDPCLKDLMGIILSSKSSFKNLKPDLENIINSNSDILDLNEFLELVGTCNKEIGALEKVNSIFEKIYFTS